MGNYYKNSEKIPALDSSFLDLIYNMEGYDTKIYPDKVSKSKPDVLTGIGGLTSAAIGDVFRRYDKRVRNDKNFKPEFYSKLAQDMYKVYSDKKKYPQWNIESIYVTEADDKHNTFLTKIQKGEYTENDLIEFGDEMILEYGNLVSAMYNDKVRAKNEKRSKEQEIPNTFRELHEVDTDCKNSFASFLYNSPHIFDNNEEMYSIIADGPSQDSDKLLFANQFMKLSINDNTARRMSLAVQGLHGPLTKETVQLVDAQGTNGLKKQLNVARVCSDINVAGIMDNDKFEKAKLENKEKCSADNIFSNNWEGYNQKASAPSTQATGNTGVFAWKGKGIQNVRPTAKKQEAPSESVPNTQNNIKQEDTGFLTNLGRAFVQTINNIAAPFSNILQNSNKNAINKAGENNDGNTNNNMQQSA